MIDDTEDWCATSLKPDGSVERKGYCDPNTASCSNNVTPTPQSTTTTKSAPQTNSNTEVEWIKVFSHNAAKAFFTVIFFFGEFI